MWTTQFHGNLSLTARVLSPTVAGGASSSESCLVRIGCCVEHLVNLSVREAMTVFLVSIMWRISEVWSRHTSAWSEHWQGYSYNDLNNPATRLIVTDPYRSCTAERLVRSSRGKKSTVNMFLGHLAFGVRRLGLWGFWCNLVGAFIQVATFDFVEGKLIDPAVVYGRLFPIEAPSCWLEIPVNKKLINL